LHIDDTAETTFPKKTLAKRHFGNDLICYRSQAAPAFGLAWRGRGALALRPQSRPERFHLILKHLERRAINRDHTAVANLIPKIKPAGAGRSGFMIKPDGEKIGPNSPGPLGFQAASTSWGNAQAFWFVTFSSANR